MVLSLKKNSINWIWQGPIPTAHHFSIRWLIFSCFLTGQLLRMALGQYAEIGLTKSNQLNNKTSPLSSYTTSSYSLSISRPHLFLHSHTYKLCFYTLLHFYLSHFQISRSVLVTQGSQLGNRYLRSHQICIRKLLISENLQYYLSIPITSP